MSSYERMSISAWLSLATRRDVMRRSTKVSIVVGTVLALINHGDSILGGTLTVQGVARIVLTYLVPFSVSTWASVQSLRSN